MTYKNEDEIKAALGISSWRNLSKDKVVRFAAMMPEMDTEVALKIIDQFPEFKEFAMDAVNAMEQAHAETLRANGKSQDDVHQAFSEIREILRGELDKGDLDWEQRKFLIEQIQETGRQQFSKDSENKRFLDGLFGKVVLGVGGALVLGLVFVGGKVIAENLDIDLPDVLPET